MMPDNVDTRANRVSIEVFKQISHIAWSFNVEAQEDMAQDVMLKIVKKYPDYGLTSGDIFWSCRSIVSNAIRARKKLKSVYISDYDSTEPTDPKTDDGESILNQIIVLDLLESADKETRKVVTMKSLGHNVQEIMEETVLPRTSVYRRYNSFLAKIKRHVSLR